MKFGRLYQIELAGTPDWPRLRYKQLKKLIKSRLASHEITSIFQTGHFKKIIREDLQSINAFWLRQEKELLDRERATEELPYLRQQQEEQVHACLRWLILNYLAVLKIAKKHDKHCATNLQNAMAKVLLMQPFVVAMRASPLFHSDGGADASQPGASDANPISYVIQKLLGMDRKYFPERLQQHIASLEDSQGSLSDPEIDSPPTVGLDPPDPRLQPPPGAPRAAKSPRKGAKSQEGEHGWPIPVAEREEEDGWMLVCYLVLVGLAWCVWYSRDSR